MDTARCWKCGAGLDAVAQPLSRYAECPACGTELHVCRMCRFFDLSAPGGCREPIAEPVGDKTRANFCGYLELRNDAWRPDDAASVQGARSALDDLFGGAPAGAAQAQDTATDEARAAAERLFGGRDPDKGE